MLPLRSAPLLVLLAACAGPTALPAAAADSASAAALDAVLLRRERARRVVVWRTRLGDGPPLTERGDEARRDRRALDRDGARAPAARPIEPGALPLGVPVAVIDEAALAALFRAAPDGWREIFRRYPGASGIAELSHPLALARDTAVVHVARQCGDKCASLFRVRVARGAGGAWGAVAVEPLSAP